MTVELERIWKETVVSLVEVLSRQELGGTEKKLIRIAEN
jgi:hypothetical protein